MINQTTLKCEETTYIKFWENHCGHKQEIERIRIDEDTRMNISGIFTIYVLYTNYIFSLYFYYYQLALF